MLLDAHTHVPSPAGPKFDRHTVTDVETFLAFLKDAGVTAAQTNPRQGIIAKSAEDIDAANKDALALHRETDGFLYPGCSVHADFFETSVEWMQRFRDEGLLWVGEVVLNCAHKYSDAPFMRLFEACAKEGHILQVHNAPDVIEIAKRFPELRLVQAHVLRDCIHALAEHPNVWLDLSGGVAGIAVGGVEIAYAAFGADRLLFGSDFTAYDPRCYVARIKGVVTDPDEREKIFSGNLIRLLAEAGSKPIV